MSAFSAPSCRNNRESLKKKSSILKITDLFISNFGNTFRVKMNFDEIIFYHVYLNFYEFGLTRNISEISSELKFFRISKLKFDEIYSY